MTALQLSPVHGEDNESEQQDDEEHGAYGTDQHLEGEPEERHGDSVTPEALRLPDVAPHSAPVSAVLRHVSRSALLFVDRPRCAIQSILTINGTAVSLTEEPRVNPPRALEPALAQRLTCARTTPRTTRGNCQ